MSNKCPVFGKVSGNAVIDSRIAILEKRIKEIELKINEGFNKQINAEIIGRFLKQFRASFDELDNRERRLFIQLIVKEITIYADDKIKLSFSLPVPPPKGVASSINSMLKKGDCSPFYSSWGPSQVS